MRASPALASLIAACLAPFPAGCAGPRTAIANLDELYSARTPEAVTYASEVTDRGFWSRTGDSFHSLFSDEPRDHDREEIDDPVEFALDNLERLTTESTAELDRFERGRAVAVVSEIGHRDPSRIVRLRAWETIVKLWNDLPLEQRRFEFDAAPVDQKELEPQIEALLALASSTREGAEALVAERADLLAHGAQVLAALRPDQFPLAQELLLLVAKCGLMADRLHAPAAVVDALRAASLVLSGQVAFLAARPEIEVHRGLADLATEPAIGAAKLLFALDPPAATLELGKVFELGGDPLVRVGWLQAVAGSGVKGEGVHPTLRTSLARDLDFPDASVSYWARRAVANALSMDPESATVEEMRARWLALGDWDRQARS